MTDYLAVLAEAALGGKERQVRPVRPPVFAFPFAQERPQPVPELQPFVEPDEGVATAARVPHRDEGVRPSPFEPFAAEIPLHSGSQARPAPPDPGDGREWRSTGGPDGDEMERRRGVAAPPAATTVPDIAPASPRTAEVRPPAPPQPASPAPPRVERVIEIVPARRPPAEPVPPGAESRLPAAEVAPQVVHVSIGRIEIRAVHPPAPPSPRAPADTAPARLSLDDYLQGRERAGRR